ncbi:hypothetical protein FRC12_002024 [Ceratobasidium sp. 428]|nr:hypothetical protein FRC12_002024 [Ceratobasidium sp. 428]
MFVKVLAVSALASVAFAAECTRTYTVQAGDWCDTISQAHNVSTYQLSTVNADKINDSCTNLEIGQVLCLGTKDRDCNITHTVAEDDTCDKIMMGAAINDTMLFGNNPQIDAMCSNIYTGEVLCVANAILAPEEVEGRHVAAAGGPPAGPPAPVPYAGAKHHKDQSSSSSIPTSTAAPAPTPAPAPAENDDDDDDYSNLPECEDPNDDGY